MDRKEFIELKNFVWGSDRVLQSMYYKLEKEIDYIEELKLKRGEDNNDRTTTKVIESELIKTIEAKELLMKDISDFTKKYWSRKSVITQSEKGVRHAFHEIKLKESDG